MSTATTKPDADRGPRYPIYIPTKGRWESRFTIRALESLGVPYAAVVESQEAAAYASVGVPEKRLLVLPFRDRGLVAARNWIWDHAAASGVKRFWTFDDNIRGFLRLNRNRKLPLTTPAFLRAIEDWVDRYVNVVCAGMNYDYYATYRRRGDLKPFVLNTRVYSNMLLDTFARGSDGEPYRNRDFYNDDTDLCLRMLKDGNCTALFNAFVIRKARTMTVAGGMTPHYQGNGRLKMAVSLRNQHPDVTRVSWKWGRYQHHVDYRRFQRNRLVRRPDVAVPDGVDEYGMAVRPAKGKKCQKSTS